MGQCLCGFQGFASQSLDSQDGLQDLGHKRGGESFKHTLTLPQLWRSCGLHSLALPEAHSYVCVPSPTLALPDALSYLCFVSLTLALPESHTRICVSFLRQVSTGAEAPVFGFPLLRERCRGCVWRPAPSWWVQRIWKRKRGWGPQPLHLQTHR